MTTINSASSTESSYYDKYNFNNLPTFASNKRNSKKPSLGSSSANTTLQEDNSFYNLSSTAASSNKVELPFVPSKNYPISNTFFAESRLPSTSVSNNHNMATSISDKFSKKSLFGTRVWSATSSDRGRLFSGNHHMNNLDQRNEHRAKNTDAQHEFFHLIGTLGSLLYLLFIKGGLWVLWVLNSIFAELLDKVRTLPTPEWQEAKREKKREDVNNMVAESTPRSKRLIFPNEKNSNLNYDIHEQKEKNPLFYKKLQSINSEVTDKLEKERENMENKTEEDDSSLEELTIKTISDPKKQYGTFFFDSGKADTNKLNLESCYLKAALNTHLLKEDKRPKDVFSRSAVIRGNLMSFHDDSKLDFKNKQKSNDSKPTFTRSTTRFQDLEWLADDNVDYLNDLESTNLFKEYQKIFAERKTMRQLMHLSTLKEHGLGVRPLKEEQAEEVEKIWMNQPSGTLISRYRINITARDLATLCDRHWLNDNIIDFYLQLIKDYVNNKGISKTHVFTTFFYTTLKNKGYDGVGRWAKRAKVDVSEMDYIFVPINHNQAHWALAVVDNVNEKIDYVDSLNGDGTSILYMLVDYMTKETKKNHGNGMNGRDYSTYFINGHVDAPQQENGFDCGVFTCTAVDYLSRNRELDYSQADMSNLRRRMAYEILKGELLDH